MADTHTETAAEPAPEPTPEPTEKVIDTHFWCDRVQLCFSMFAARPSTLQHLLLFGPPGSGKTTSAAWLVDTIWGNRKALMCMSMNAADERSLESIRQKVFPFLRMDWRETTGTDHGCPRFLILDECETLTEAAQLSLQTMLNTDPRDVCVILICNSQSRIHPKLRQRLLKIRYDPPHATTATTATYVSSTLFHQMTRGDLRQSSRQQATEERLWKYLHLHPSRWMEELFDDTTVDVQTLLTEIMLLCDSWNQLNDSILDQINLIYPLLTDYSMTELKKEMMILLRMCRAQVAAASPSL